jgi:class 3 adenylate cyclase
MGGPSVPAVQAGRAAADRYEWSSALEQLTEADQAEPLDAEDLERLGNAAWWTGRLDDSIIANERAYAAHLEAGRKEQAARVALRLARDYGRKLSHVAGAWEARAERLLVELPECPAHGWRARSGARRARLRGEVTEALALAQQATEIAERQRDHDLAAVSRHEQGRVLVDLGRLDEGFALLEEAALAGVAGEITPWAISIVYCGMIIACRDTADYRRAGEWTEAAKRWCSEQAIRGFPGQCRIYRSEILRLRGAWREAEREVRSACDELVAFTALDAASEGFYELGEIRLRTGDLLGAEEAFRQARELGHGAEPGQSMLRLARGDGAGALDSIRVALADPARPRLARARLLAGMVEIAIPAGAPDEARRAAAELEQIAGQTGTSGLWAGAALAAGASALADGDGERAARHARDALRRWQELDAPYEAARARELLGRALASAGDDSSSDEELRMAKSTFDRLGAALDARRVGEALGHDVGAGERTTRTFMFTDIVRSTSLVEAIGDEAWEHVVRWHDTALREEFARAGGEEVDHAGDGFFVAFTEPSGALACAISIQRRLAEHRREHGFAPQVRIGVHEADAARLDDGYRGRGVHEAARIAALADGGEIVSGAACARGRPDASPPRFVEVKGISDPLEVMWIDWHAGVSDSDSWNGLLPGFKLG